MYVSTIISDRESELLKSMIGKTFDKYKCDPFIYSPMVYGIVGIYINGTPIKITSLLKEVQRFMNKDEVAAFQISETTDDDIKTFMDNGEMIDTPINSKIGSILVVNDFQTVEHEKKLYKFSSTVGLIFIFEDSLEVSFEIGTWFSEMITIRKGYDLIKDFTPVDDFADEWKDLDGYIPSCKREVVVLN